MKNKLVFDERADSSIRSEGAELFVQSILMLEYGIITTLASRNMPDYDVIAHNLGMKKDCKISVKYRKANNSDGFRFKSLDNFDFFIGILGKRGKIGVHNDDSSLSKELLSECYIFSNSEVRKNVRTHKKYYILLRNEKNLTTDRKNNWTKILKYLSVNYKD